MCTLSRRGQADAARPGVSRTTRRKNERKFLDRVELADGGQLYSLDVPGKLKWRGHIFHPWMQADPVEVQVFYLHPRWSGIRIRQVENLPPQAEGSRPLNGGASISRFDVAGGSELTEALGRFGFADVRAFGLTWEDCEQLLRQLDYKARVEITTG